MNEPKKRGRKSNAEKALWKGETQESASLDVSGAVVHIIPDQRPTTADDIAKVDRFRAQAYALRVWNGQSRDVPRSERLKRVQAALEGQGLSMEGVEL